MKKVLIVSHALELGGAERSLIGLLDALDPNVCTVDLFLLRHEGGLLRDIPQYVNLLPQVSSYTVLARPMKDTLREGHVLLTAARLKGKMKAKQYDKKHRYIDSSVALEYSHKYTWHLMPDIQPVTEYDLAVSFLTPHYFVVKKVRAKKKIAWIHTDYSTVQVNVLSELAMWSAYDHIMSISNAVSESFLKTFPSLRNKLILMENILSKNMLVRQSAEFYTWFDMKKVDTISLLSVGRFTNAKNFDNVPIICKILLKRGLKIRWYLIGFGGDEALIRQIIHESGMVNHVIILGKKYNPYPYMKDCDLYVQPSRYEGKCVSVREAQMLGKPVVITKYATSFSQLEDGIDGVIVPMDNEGCADGIARVLQNPMLMKVLSENCLKRDYSNSNQVGKLYSLL